MLKDRKARLPMGKRAILLCVCAAALLLLGLALWFQRNQDREYELTAFAMGSYVQQTVWGTDPEEAAAEAVRQVEDLEREISWREDEAIAGLNSSAGREPISVSPEILGLLEETLTLCRKSGGAFDITLGPVTRLWDFDNQPHLPDEEELEKAMDRIGWQDVELTSDSGLLAREGMAVDMGAIGKGAACDIMISCYQDAGVSGAVAAVGGSIGLYGQKPGNGLWQIGIRDPDGQGSLGILKLPGGFVSTSGSYEKYFEQDGKTYCHLLDPRTGYPAESGLVSVTVWCPPEMDAKFPGALSDGLATACFILGLEDSLGLLESYGAEAVFIDENGVITLTEDLKNRFTLTAEGYTLAEGD